MPPLDSLRLADFNDLDLLHLLDDVGNEEGWATAEDVAREIGLTHKHPAQCVGSRFAWLYRFGVMDQKQSKRGMLWRLNEIGYALIYPNEFSATLDKALGKLDAGQVIALTDRVANGLQRESRQATHLARRAWRHRLGGWRDPQVDRGKR